MPKFELNPTGARLSASNALSLAQSAALAYRSAEVIMDVVQNEWGFHPPQIFSNPPTDTQAFLAFNDNVMVLAFRGTVMTSITDWLIDGKFALVPSKSKGRVHHGFNEALNSIWDDLSDMIYSRKSKEQTLWVTGHSLGGALAMLAVDWLTEEGVKVQGMYTFGQPRVGNKEFVENFNFKMQNYAFRFVNNSDVVTQVPFSPGYKHADAECFFDNGGKLYMNHIFWNWWRSVSEDAELRTQADNSVTYIKKNPGGLEAHKLDYYIKYLQ